MILGLDLSLTSTGWAVIAHDGGVVTGIISDTHGHISNRLRCWKFALQGLLDCYAPDHIVIEDLPRGVRHGGVELGMIHATFWLSEDVAADVTAVTPASLKQYATGRGNAGKDQMLAEAIRRLDYQGHSHDEADALWLADLGARLALYDRPLLPAAHLKALDKVKTAA